MTRQIDGVAHVGSGSCTAAKKRGVQREGLFSAGGETSVFGGNAGTRCCKRERRDSDDTPARVTRYLGRLRGAVEWTSSLWQWRAVEHCWKYWPEWVALGSF